MLRLDGYIRVSRVGGRIGESFISPEVQREQIEMWAKLMSAQIIEWHTDLDQSGGTMVRPAFQQAYDRVLRKETGGLVVAKLDRFARSAAEAGQVVRQILDAGGVFASAAERIDPTTPFGKFGLTIMFAMAELELDRITENWHEAQGRAIARGRHLRAPFGYRVGDDGRLVADENAEFVSEVFRKRAAGGGWAELAAWLNEHCKPPKSNRWTTRTVKVLIGRRAYLGEAHHGEHVHPDAHERLVAPELWQAAQRRVLASRPPRGVPGLLSGLVRCAACRHSMRPTNDNKPRRDKKGNYPGQYRCILHHGAGDCPAGASVVRKTLDNYVVAQFAAHLGDVAGQTLVSAPEVEGAYERLQEAEGEQAAFRDDLRIRSVLGQDGFLAGLQARTAAVTAAQEALDRAQAGSPPPDLGGSLDDWESLSVLERRALLRSGIDCIFVRRARVKAPMHERVRILWHGEAPNDLPHAGVPGKAIVPFDWPDDPLGTGVPAA
ncbi:MAG: recombinase family protein [Solirubrobacterales bacterium]